METSWVCTFTKIKPWGSCTNRSSFACIASIPWELKRVTLAKDIYYQEKLHFHCLGRKAALVVQIKQMMRSRASRWNWRSKVRIWFKDGMSMSRHCMEIRIGFITMPAKAKKKGTFRTWLGRGGYCAPRTLSLTLAAVHSQPEQSTLCWSSCFEELRLTSSWLWMQRMTHFKQVGQENLHLSAFRDLFQNTEDLPWKCFPYCLMLWNRQWEYWEH